MDAFAHCEHLVREADKDRFFATLFAPAKYRRALFALYAFNLEVARVRELAREPLPGEMRLQFWVDFLENKSHGAIEAHPVASALTDSIVRYGLRPQRLADLLEARRFDLYNEPFGVTEELEAYAEKTSSVLIELAARILSNGSDPGIGALARHAGIAYAVAGLLRAFPLHAARGQLYVPLELLDRHAASPQDVFAGKNTPEIRAALADMRQLARRHLVAAQELRPATEPALLPALLPVALVRPTLKRLERRRNNPFLPVEIPSWRRQWIIWRAARDPSRITRP
jgi:phytoene synthase